MEFDAHRYAALKECECEALCARCEVARLVCSMVARIWKN